MVVRVMFHGPNSGKLCGRGEGLPTSRVPSRNLFNVPLQAPLCFQICGATEALAAAILQCPRGILRS